MACGNQDGVPHRRVAEAKDVTTVVNIGAAIGGAARLI
jgi:hypothetical protein